MINVLALVLAIGFASFRLMWLLRYDTIFEGVRQYIWSWFPVEEEGIKYIRPGRVPKGAQVVPVSMPDGTNVVMVTKGTWLGTLIHCPYCLSAYTGFFLTVLAWASKLMVGLTFGSWFIVWMASWAVCVYIFAKMADMTEIA